MLTKITSPRRPQFIKHVRSCRKAFISSQNNTTSTVDSNEVVQFNTISTNWWDEMGVVKPLHSMNKLRIPFVRDGLINTGVAQKKFSNTPKPLTNLAILEVGCGGGILTESLARLGGQTTGIDVAADILQQATEHANSLKVPLTNLNYVLETVEEHCKTNFEKYDAVVTSEVLEHVSEKQIFLNACVKCLKPGGSIFITTINKTTFSWLGGIIFAEYIAGLVPRGTHDWNKFIAPHQTQRMLEDEKCRTRIIHGMLYNFVNNTWYWTENSPFHYALQSVKE